MKSIFVLLLVGLSLLIVFTSLSLYVNDVTNNNIDLFMLLNNDLALSSSSLSLNCSDRLTHVSKSDFIAKCSACQLQPYISGADKCVYCNGKCVDNSKKFLFVSFCF